MLYINRVFLIGLIEILGSNTLSLATPTTDCTASPVDDLEFRYSVCFTCPVGTYYSFFHAVVCFLFPRL